MKEYRGLHIPGFETFDDDLEDIQGSSSTNGDTSAGAARVNMGPEYVRLAQWYSAVRTRPSFAATVVRRVIVGTCGIYVPHSSLSTTHCSKSGTFLVGLYAHGALAFALLVFLKHFFLYFFSFL